MLIKAKDDASQVIDGVGSKFGGFAKLAGAAALTGGTAIAAGLAVGIRGAGDLQQSVANISTIKPTINTSEVFNALNEMSTRVPQSAKDLGDGLYNIFSSIETTQGGALQLLETFAKGAVGASTDAQTFGTAALGVMNAYGLSVDQAQHISDVFFNTVNAGVVTGPELAASLGPVTQAAKSAGVSLDELGGFIVGVTKEGGPAAQNINNLNNLFQKFTTVDAQREMHRLGIETTDAQGKFLPMTGVLQQLKDKLSGMTDSARAAELQKIFPDAQARQGAQTILSQLDAVKSAIDVNKNATGSASDAYEKMSSTFNSQSTLLKNTFVSILTTIGAELLPAITPLIKTFAEHLPGAFEKAKQMVGEVKKAFETGDWSAITSKLGEVGTRIGELAVEWGGKLIGWVADAIPPLLAKLGEWASALWDWIVNTGLPALAEKLADWGQAFVDWVTDAVPPLLEKAGELVKTLGDWVVEDGLPALGDKLVEWGAAFVDWIVRVPTPLLEKAGNLLRELGGWILSTALPDLIVKLGEWGGAFIGWIAPKIPPLIAELVKLHVRVGEWILTEALPAIVEKLAEWGQAFVGFVAKDVIPNLAGALGAILSTIGAWLKDDAIPWALRELAQLGTAMIDGIKAGIAAAARGLANAAIDAVKDALDAAKDFLHIRSPSQVFADQIGAPIGQGIAAGILSTAGAVAAAAHSVATVALDAAKLSWAGGGGGTAMTEPAIKISNQSGGISGLTQSNVSWGDQSFVQWFADAALSAVSSAFGALNGIFPVGTELWQALGFQSQETYERWKKAVEEAKASGAFKGEGLGLFGSTLGDVQSLLDILYPNPQHHAEGGVFTRPTTMWDAAGRAHQFGEAGPEVLAPLPRGMNALSPIVVNIYGDVFDSDHKFEQKVRLALAGAQSRRY